MRTMKRNKRKMYYSLYLGKFEITDRNGDLTGEKEDEYSVPVEFKANISPNKGESSIEPFGVDINYSRVICTNEDLPIDEHTLIWLETEPPDKVNDGATADYIVVRKADSLNSTLFAVRKRTKNGL